VATSGRGPSPALALTSNSNDPTVGPLGPGWTHSYALRLVRPEAGAGTGAVVLVGPQGRRDRYLPVTVNGDGSATYAPPPGVGTTLVREDDGTYTATHLDQSAWRLDAGGRLTAIKDRFNNQSSLTYDGSGRLASVTDPAGRGALTYDTYSARRRCRGPLGRRPASGQRAPALARLAARCGPYAC
jgi:YD repeat-containing protein